MAEARVLVGDTQALCDIITAQRIDPSIRYQFGRWDRDRAKVQGLPARSKALKVLQGLSVFHFPIAFPEVFLRKRPGFDVLLGNPPWEKARVEEHEYWARHFPGLRGLNTAEKRARTDQLRVLRPDLAFKWEQEREETERTRDAVRHIPGMDTGHPDLFRAFLWRFTQLVTTDHGRVAVVLPGDAFKIKGGASLRSEAVKRFDLVDISFLTNKREWVFDLIDERKFISLFTASSSANRDCAVRVTPECNSLEEWNLKRVDFVELPNEWIRDYSSSIIIPTLSEKYDKIVLDVMRRSPPLRTHPELHVRRVYADFETNRDRAHYHSRFNNGDWPVYGGRSFDLWEPDRGPEHYYSQTTEAIVNRAQERRARSPRNSAYGAMPGEWRRDIATHPIMHPRIAFRNVTNRTNSRTFLCCLIPGRVITVETAPWVLFLDPKHDIREEAYLLGVISSLICDWWVRRFAEGHIDEEAFNALRVPVASLKAKRFSQRVIALAARLAAPDDRFAEWATEVGVAHGLLDPAEKQDMMHELDAVVARLYGLDEAQLTHIFETFHEGWDYESRLKAVLGHFSNWGA